MMKCNKKHNGRYYTSKLCNIVINIGLLFILTCIIFTIYIIFRLLLIHVFQVERSISNMISIIFSMLLFIVPMISKAKKTYTIIANKLMQKAYRILKNRFLPINLKTTTQQATVINKVLSLLKNTGNHLIALESAPGKGKTMTAVFLVDNIGSDKKLLDLFIKLQKNIYYFDAGFEKTSLVNILDNIADASKSLIIIDNIHKFSVATLTLVLDKITAISEYANNTGSKNLIILLYQSIKIKDLTRQLLNNYLKPQVTNVEEYFFNLDSKANHNELDIVVNPKIDVDGTILNKIRVEFCDPLQTQLLNIYSFAKQNDLIVFLLSILNKRANPESLVDIDKLQFIAIVVILSIYTGFITEKSVFQLWKNCSNQYRKSHCRHLIKYFSENRFMTPFPLMQRAFLFNEILANEYRRRLFSIVAFRDYYYQCAKNIYVNKVFDAAELEWLFLITCKASDLEVVPEITREKLFYTCIESLNKSYILSVLEEELSLEPQKQSILQVELGILYIKTGQWTKARNVLKPYINQTNIPSKIWRLQLQIIEADHGVDDKENLNMLSKIISTSKDSYIQFQARYWTAHIQMEQGNFSLEPWNALKTEVESNTEWRIKSTYSHLIHRITADTCRTFFLKGINVPDIFNNTLNFFEKFRIHPIRQEDTALIELEEAHYIHYDLIYQLGIWNMYCFDHDKEKSKNDAASLNALIVKALQQYDRSIIRFSKAGIKTWRTAQIRRDELSLCDTTPNYVEVLAHLDEFERYASENHVDVFIGFVECLRGKALALYALNKDIESKDSSYEHRLEESLVAFQKSERTYKHYGNKFGFLRSKFLYTLVDMVNQLVMIENPNKALKNIHNQLEDLKNQFSQENIREQQVLNYLTTLPSIRIGNLGNVLKYYPIVLQ